MFISFFIGQIGEVVGGLSSVEEMLDEKNVFAVVGASRNPEKYGHKVFKDLLEAGYEVYPVNPKAGEILGRKAYGSLKELPKRPDVVVFVVPPAVTERMAEECVELGVKYVWMQPGAESEVAIRELETAGVRVIHGVCIMITRRELKAGSP